MSLFDDFFRDPITSSITFPPLRTVRAPNIPLNLKKLEDKYLVELEAAGYSTDDISIELDGDHLVIAGSEKGSNEADGEYLVKEFWQSNFTRRVKLPKDIDTESISAEMNGGILNVAIPRLEDAKSNRRQIPITTT